MGLAVLGFALVIGILGGIIVSRYLGNRALWWAWGLNLAGVVGSIMIVYQISPAFNPNELPLAVNLLLGGWLGLALTASFTLQRRLSHR